MSSSKILCPWKRCKSVVDIKNRKTVHVSKRCKTVAYIESSKARKSVRSPKLLPPLKRCNSVSETENSKTGDDVDPKKLSPPLKRCKSVVADNENTKTGDHVDPNKLLCPLKRCNSVVAQNENSKTGDHVDPKKLLFPLKEGCNFVVDDEEEDDLIGKHLDVISFLSNNGNTTYLVRSNGQFVSLDFVLGKPLIIYRLPLPLASDDHRFHAMINTYTEVPRPDFEMVLVVSTHNKADFVDFYSADIPCLAIPFSDSSTRDSICSFIGPASYYLDGSAIFVDPTGRISHHRGIPELFRCYGSEWFGRNEDDIQTQEDVLRLRLDPLYRYGLGTLPEAIKMDPLLDVPLSLHKDILLCSPSHMLSRFGGAKCGGAGQSSLMVSELSNKYVGLYLCINMLFLVELHETHQQCVANKQELEIVLVCMPLFEDSKAFHKRLIKALKLYNITSWFIFPYEHNVCRRMWRIFGQRWDIDKLIILPPNCISGELEGRTVVEQIGIKAYPFTRSTILEQRFTALKSLTPASFFKGTCKEQTCLFRNVNGTKSNVPQSEIKGKKLLLYLDWLDLSDDHGELCHLLIKHYAEIQAMGCEVVFVPFDGSDTHHAQLVEMPWPIMCVSADVQYSVICQLVFRYERICRQLFAVGEDGEILATRAEKRLEKYGVTGYLFHDKLRKDITVELNNLKSEEEEYFRY